MFEHPTKNTQIKKKELNKFFLKKGGKNTPLRPQKMLKTTPFSTAITNTRGTGTTILEKKQSAKKGMK
jgi:hypothetical protein